MMALARFVASLITAVVMGWLWLRFGRGEWLRMPSRDHLVGDSKFETFRRTATHDFLHAGGFLVIGGLASAFLNVVVPQAWLQAVADRPVISVLALAGLAVLLSICSEADAFVAASLGQFSLTARLAFLVVGPDGRHQAGRLADRDVRARVLVAVRAHDVRRGGRRRLARRVVAAVTRDVGAVILVLVGASVLRITGDDTYLRYVRATLRPWLVASGVLLIALGLLALLDVWRSVRAEARASRADAQAGRAGARAGRTGTVAGADDGHDDGDDDDGHGHGSSVPRTAWLLVLPVAALLVVPPPALGAFTAERQTATTVAPAYDAAVPPLPPGDPVTVTLGDYASRAVWDNGRTLVGRSVQLTGFVSSAPDGGWYLTRLALTCCAADATVTKILPVDATSHPPANTWLLVVGQWVPGGGTQSETAIPHLKIVSMDVVPAPTNPYE